MRATDAPRRRSQFVYIARESLTRDRSAWRQHRISIDAQSYCIGVVETGHSRRCTTVVNCPGCVYGGV